MYKIYNAFICSKDFCCSKKPLLIMKLTMVLLTAAFLQVSAKSSDGIVKATEVAAKTISGKVIDEKGQPLPGVVVKVKGTQVATATDVQGNYKITSPDDNAILVFSFVGYDNVEMSARGKTVINITMSSTNTGLDEVVVVAYGTQKRTSVTGAVSTVSPDEIKKNAVSDIVNTITGRTPGVRVVQLSSQPGLFQTSIDIRGFSSMTGGGVDANQSGGPLFVIDGVPRTQADFARLDPNEIESFSVLKDATAAIYGVKAANGVILVTTKKGSQGAVQTSYSGQWGASFITNYPDLANGYQYAVLLDEQQINTRETGRGDPITPQFNQQQVADLLSGKTPSVDWVRLTVKKRTNQQTHNVSLNGGSDKVKFFTSAGYFQEGGVLATNIEKDQKFNFRQNVNAVLAKGLTLDINLGLIDVVTSAPNTSSGRVYNLVRNTWQISPLELPYLNGDTKKPTQFILVANDNPVALETRDVAGFDDQNARRFASTFTLTYALPQVPGLTARVLVAYDNNYSLEKNFAKAFYQYNIVSGVETAYQHGAPTTLTERFNEDWRNDIQFSLNYQKHFGKHNFTFLALYENSYTTGNTFNTSKQFAVDALPQLDAGISSSALNGGNAIQPAGLQSYVGRVNYDYAGKYLLELGGRSDGSSYLASATRFGFFPYASAGWRISEEPFIKNNFKWVDNIKLRASYGKLGDDQAAGPPNFPYFQSGFKYPSGGSVYDGDAGRSGGSAVGTVFNNSGGITKGYSFSWVVNPAITWYTSNTSDIGLEMSFFNGKLTFEGDVFRRDRNGILATPVIAFPGNYGAVLPKYNLNSDRTQGFELTLGHHNRAGEVTYNISANMGFARTNWRHYEESVPTSPYDTWRNKSNGRYIDQIWGYQVNGQFQNYQQIYSAPIQDGGGNRNVLPGDLNYVDLNGDGQINNSGDYGVIANGGAKPLIYFGTTIDAAYKGFDITFLIQGATMYHVTFQDQLSRPFFFGGADPISAFFDRWHRQDLFDPNSPWVPGRFPSTGQRQQYKDIGFGTNGSQAATGNTFNVFDGTYARLKQIQIGYSLPKKLISKLNIQRVRVFATAYDVLTWNPHGLSFVDPEYTDTNLYGYNYPITMNVNMGVQVTF